MLKYWMQLAYYDQNGEHVGDSQIEILGTIGDNDAVVRANQLVKEMNELCIYPAEKPLGRFIQKGELVRVIKEIFVNPFH